MEIVYSARAQEDISSWKQSGNIKIMNRITALLNSIEETPFSGIGKPEALKHQLTDCWSRRIIKEHRIVYRVSNTEIEIISMKFHY